MRFRKWKLNIPIPIGRTPSYSQALATGILGEPAPSSPYEREELRIAMENLTKSIQGKRKLRQGQAK